MSVLAFLIPVTLVMGALGLAAFFWSLRSGQYEDLTGDAERILFDADDTPLTPPRTSSRRDPTSKETTK